MMNSTIKTNKRLFYILFAIIFVNAHSLFSQTQSTNSTSHDFENQKDNWSFSNETQWDVTNEKAFGGNYSLKFNTPTPYTASAITSIDTQHTILKVRVAKSITEKYIIASSYEGIVMRVSYGGEILWKNPLSGGIINHDLWCQDLTGDGNDEILVANANGTIYCLNGLTGKVMWEFKQNEAPMYAVCAIRKDNTTYVVCGGFDRSIYYLDTNGQFVKEINSSSYSKQKPFSNTVAKPPEDRHTANFIRPIPQTDGSEILAVHGTINQINVKGVVYFFNPLENSPYQEARIGGTGKFVVGDFDVIDINDDGENEIIFGSSAITGASTFIDYSISNNTQTQHLVRGIITGYAVTHTEKIPNGGQNAYFVLTGNNLLIVDSNFDVDAAEKLTSKYAFNDVWQDPDTKNVILASAQSGGSAIHIIDVNNPDWKDDFVNLDPPGKIAAILKNTSDARVKLATFNKPAHERNPLPVYLLSDAVRLSGFARGIKNKVESTYNNPLFFIRARISGKEAPDSWMRDTIPDPEHRDKYKRKSAEYTLSQAEVLNQMRAGIDATPVGIANWGGHGNDPFHYSPDTKKKIIDYAHSQGKQTILMYPEVESTRPNFQYIADHLFTPLAKHAQGKNTQLYIRSKNIFFQANSYLPFWENMLSGKYADVFVPSMEETTDKTMDLSIASRLGMWASGAVNAWGTRAVRDNPSFDRSRQYGYQMLPNHFLRHLVYNIACGAQYINNHPVDQDYISIYWELIAKGALYIPKREEIVSFSPVHLSMSNPDNHYIEDGTNVKWTTFYDKNFEDNNPFVFSHMNGTWPGAPVTEWDFSKYAAGVKDRRLNFLPTYENGIVLITPPQSGALADLSAPRGKLTDHLHPIYKNIMKEYITNGRHYLSSDGTQTFPANTYYKNIEADIKAGAKKLPLTVTGDVAWVVAQTAPNHLRLTIVDGGYLNPDKRKATITFNTVTPAAMRDVLDNKTFDISNPSKVIVDIPCGLFRFIDIELTNNL